MAMTAQRPADELDYIRIGDASLHYSRIGVEHPEPALVFLHEGLGSVELWRDFPSSVVGRVSRPGLIYSRRGNGWSSTIEEPRRSDYLHREATESLPLVIEQLVDGPPILIGHSDGASIAVIHAGAGHPVELLVLIAPHVFVEPQALSSIAAMRRDFWVSGLDTRMAKYHADPKATFFGWADIWLSPDFTAWNIEEYLGGIQCPTLLIQGEADEYGTTGQLDAIEEQISAPTRRLLVPGAEHSPHLSELEMVTAEVASFIEELAR
jgi:pimeloyl-ACP methyl ester carboxylesterase